MQKTSRKHAYIIFVRGGFCTSDKGDFVHLVKSMRGILSTLYKSRGDYVHIVKSHEMTSRKHAYIILSEGDFVHLTGRISSTLQKHEGDFFQLYKNEQGGFCPDVVCVCVGGGGEGGRGAGCCPTLHRK